MYIPSHDLGVTSRVVPTINLARWTVPGSQESYKAVQGYQCSYCRYALGGLKASLAPYNYIILLILELHSLYQALFTYI